LPIPAIPNSPTNGHLSFKSHPSVSGGRYAVLLIVARSRNFSSLYSDSKFSKVSREIIVDQEVHLCGSHNWLSYRGDYLPRGELVYKVTIPEQVNEAYSFLSGRFLQYAEELWKQGLSDQDCKLAETAFGILIALEKEDIALNYLENSNWLELVPIWLQAVCQSLESGQLSVHSPAFEKAFSLLSQISDNDLFMPLLRQNMQQVIPKISKSSNKRFLKLLNQEEVWNNLKRLGIATNDQS